ncbi:unnamed protein product, partial [Didymodactylos carnosus]
KYPLDKDNTNYSRLLKSSNSIQYSSSSASIPIVTTASISNPTIQGENEFEDMSNLDGLVDSDFETDRSVKAITDTIFHVLTPKIDMSLTTTTKRTILKRLSGEIVAEDNVLKQLQAREKQEKTKQAKVSRSKAPKKFRKRGNSSKSRLSSYRRSDGARFPRARVYLWESRNAVEYK